MPGEVKTLYRIGQALALVASHVLLVWHDLLVGLPKVRVSHQGFVTIGDFIPQLPTRLCASVADYHCQNLPTLIRNRDPNPCLPLLLAPNKRPNLIKFDAVIVNKRRIERQGERGFQAGQSPPFSLSHLVSVLRLILNTRAMPRIEARS